MADAARQFWPHATPRARDVDPIHGVERDDLSLTSPPPTPPTPRARPAPRASARFLTAWLRVHLNTAGAAAMVRRYGARRVIDALYDGILVETTLTDAEPYTDARGLTALRQIDRTVRTINPALTNPGGYLRWLLQHNEEGP